MHEAMAVGPGHAGIDEGDDLPGMIDGSTRKIDGRAERAIAVLVGGRDLNERHIEGIWPAWHEEFGNRGQIDRDVAGTPGVDSSPVESTDEACAHVKVPRPAWVSVGCGANHECREELNVLQFLPAGDQRLDEWGRGHEHPSQKHVVS